MKKIIFRIALGVVLLVVIALVVVFFSLNSIVKKGVETVGPRLTQVDTRLKAAELSPLSGNGRLTGLFVGNPQGYQTPSAIQVGDIKVGLQISSVLSDTMVVNVVNIQAPEITFEGNLTGNNLSKILANIEAASGGDQAAKKEPSVSKSGKKFYVKDLLVQGGKIHVSVSGLGTGGAATLPLPELHLQNIGSKENGVTAAELASQILKPLLASATKVATESVANISQGVQSLGKQATGQVDQATKTLKGLFNK